MAAEDRPGRIDSDRCAEILLAVTAVTLVLLGRRAGGGGLSCRSASAWGQSCSPWAGKSLRRARARRSGSVQRLPGSNLAPAGRELNALLDPASQRGGRASADPRRQSAAHALKTPLSVMLAEAEGAGPRALADGGEPAGPGHAPAMSSTICAAPAPPRAAAASGERARRSLAVLGRAVAHPPTAIFRGKVSIDWDAPEDLDFAGERLRPPRNRRQCAWRTPANAEFTDGCAPRPRRTLG